MSGLAADSTVSAVCLEQVIYPLNLNFFIYEMGTVISPLPHWMCSWKYNLLLTDTCRNMPQRSAEQKSRTKVLPGMGLGGGISSQGVFSGRSECGMISQGWLCPASLQGHPGTWVTGPGNSWALPWEASIQLSVKGTPHVTLDCDIYSLCGLRQVI